MKNEILDIVWAFKNLRNYLYGVNNIEIYTDHQPLSFSISPLLKAIHPKLFMSQEQQMLLRTLYQGSKLIT